MGVKRWLSWGGWTSALRTAAAAAAANVRSGPLPARPQSPFWALVRALPLFQGLGGLVYVVDSLDRDRLAEVRQELARLLQWVSWAGKAGGQPSGHACSPFSEQQLPAACAACVLAAQHARAAPARRRRMRCRAARCCCLPTSKTCPRRWSPNDWRSGWACPPCASSAAGAPALHGCWGWQAVGIGGGAASMKAKPCSAAAHPAAAPALCRHAQGTSMHFGEGLFEGFDWLARTMAGVD